MLHRHSTTRLSKRRAVAALFAGTMISFSGAELFAQAPEDSQGLTLTAPAQSTLGISSSTPRIVDTPSSQPTPVQPAMPTSSAGTPSLAPRESVRTHTSPGITAASEADAEIARRPWLLDKLIKPKTEPSIKMDPPRPPVDLPDPPSMSKIVPKSQVDGWLPRRDSESQPIADSTLPSYVAPSKDDPSKSKSTSIKLPEKQAAPETAPSTTAANAVPAPKTESKQKASKSLGDKVATQGPLRDVVVDTSELIPPDSSHVSSIKLTPDGASQYVGTEPRPTEEAKSENSKPAEAAAPNREKPSVEAVAENQDPEKIERDYAGYPKKPFRLMSPAYRMKNMMRQTLRYYHGRPEIANERSNWGMMHSIMVYEIDTRVLVGRKSYSAVAWIAGNNACRGQKLLDVDANGNIMAKSGVGLQGHQAQLLAVLSLCEVPIDYTLYAGENKYTVRDLVKSEMRACKTGEELTFTLIGLSHYLDTEAVWTNAEGETWDFERLIREELNQQIVGAACGGTHRLMGYAHALRKRRAEGRPISGQWKRAEIYTYDFVKYVYKLQNRDGSMSTDWFEGREDNGDLDRKIQTTGHMVEWLLTLTPDSQLQNNRLVSAIRFLTNSMYQERNKDWKIGPKGHALRSLAMYYERVYKSGPAWQNNSVARSQSNSSR